MKLKVNDMIICDDKNEFLSVQKYLFKRGFRWCNNTTKIIYPRSSDKLTYLIEINLKTYSKTENLMFSYSHNIEAFGDYYNKIDASKLLRKEKIKKILQ